MMRIGWTPRREEPRWKRVLGIVLSFAMIGAIVAFHVSLGWVVGRFGLVMEPRFVAGIVHLACGIGTLMLAAFTAGIAWRYLFTAPDFALLVTMPLAPRALFARRLRLLARHELGSLAAVVVAVALAVTVGSGHGWRALVATFVVACVFVTAAVAAGIAATFHGVARRALYAAAGLVVAAILVLGLQSVFDRNIVEATVEWVREDPLRGLGRWWPGTFAAEAMHHLAAGHFVAALLAAAPTLALLALALAALAAALPRYTMQRIAQWSGGLSARRETRRRAEPPPLHLQTRWSARRIAVLRLVTWVAKPEALWPRIRRLLLLAGIVLLAALAIRSLLPAPWTYAGTAIVIISMFVGGITVSSDSDHATTLALSAAASPPPGPLVGRSPFATRGTRQHPVIATLPLPIEEAVREAIRFHLTGIAIWLAVMLVVFAIYPYDRLIVLGALALVTVAVTMGSVASPIHMAGSYIRDPRRSGKADLRFKARRLAGAILAGLGLAALFVLAEFTQSNWILAAMPLYLALLVIGNMLLTWHRVKRAHRHHWFDAEYPQRTLPQQRW